MSGRVKKKRLAIQSLFSQSTDQSKTIVCPLCLRQIPKSQRDAHHLIPKSRGGVETVILHKICHQQIHALLTENQLARDYSTIEQLKLHPKINTFVKWVKDKPVDLRASIKKSHDKGLQTTL